MTPVVVAVVALYATFVLARLAVFGGDVSGFVTAGAGITDAAEAPEHLRITAGTDGYDGQAYYRLARSPLTDDVTDHGITFTRPAYWQTRIGYPLLAWTAALGGQEALVPAAMLGVNLLAVAVIVALAAGLARSLGRSAWWAAVPGLWAGFLVGVGQDLTEPVAGAMLLLALLALRRQRHTVAAAALTAAAVTRETTLLVPLVLLVLLIPWVRDAARQRVPIPWWVPAVPIAGYAAWRTVVRARWADQVPHPPGDNTLGMPFQTLLGYLERTWAVPGPEWTNLVLLLPFLAAMAVLTHTAVRRRGLPHERLALAGYLILLAALPVWDRGQAYVRWGCEPLLLGWLVLIGTRRRTDDAPQRRDGALIALTALTLVLWGLTATQSVGYPRTDGVWNGLWTWS